jgi:Putative Flp pilus-assembly TadE/G-like
MRPSDDEGSLIPLIAFYFIVAATLILVVADASKFYLARQSLQGVADAAALASAQSVSAQGIYGGGDNTTLRLDGDVCQAVDDYGTDNGLADRFDDLTMAGYPGDSPGPCLALGADHVTVVAHDTVRLPLVSILGVLDLKIAHGVPVTVIAHAALRCDTC